MIPAPGDSQASLRVATASPLPQGHTLLFRFFSFQEVNSSCVTEEQETNEIQKLFGVTGNCAACSKLIPAFEMVMRAKENVYHLDCFACQLCNQRFCVGDKFFLKNNMILCQTDYEEGLMKEGYAPQLAGLTLVKVKKDICFPPRLVTCDSLGKLAHTHAAQCRYSKQLQKGKERKGKKGKGRNERRGRERKGKDRKGKEKGKKEKERKGKERKEKGKERKEMNREGKGREGKERKEEKGRKGKKGKERKGKERKGKERKGKEGKGKERKGKE
ncbi:LIM domain only protein 3 [Bagarius yarrelli]|uniref:LIM domain only protein 3 n=1 Tax=Bagarius yarrelli TaxID=175774 RepID=A0A556THD8_BAGYA|nr:LIM domain only protein 3 [Bagarius yarrelli]